MIIEITGVNCWNKGAELMALAIKERFASKYPHVQLAVDQRFGNYLERAQYSFFFRSEFEKMGRAKIALSLLPPTLKKSMGLVDSRQIDAVLDASGFAFGDQHPPERTERFASRVEAFKRAGKPVILLPQALGPFNNKRIKAAFSRVLQSATYVFARDPKSFDYARECAPNTDRLGLAPDFTNLLCAHPTNNTERSQLACIVPNQRMIEKATSESDSNAYIPLLSTCISTLKRKGISSFLLIHGSHDASLVEPIQKALGYSLDVISESEPIKIKRILGESHLVIGSRFHALVSSLSQSVPSIATSWSHKYEMLFDDYGCPNFVLPISADENQISSLIDAAIGEEREKLISNLTLRANRIKKDSEEMWFNVEKKLGF